MTFTAFAERPLSTKHHADAVKLCDCAACGAVLCGESMAGRTVLSASGKVVPHVAGRILGRPYCGPCLGTPRAYRKGVADG